MWVSKALLVAPLALFVVGFQHDDYDLDIYGRDEGDFADLWVRDFDDELDIRDLDDEVALWSRYASLPEDIYVRDLESWLWSRELVHTDAAHLSTQQMAAKTKNYNEQYKTDKGIVKDFKQYGKEEPMKGYMGTFIENAKVSKEARVQDLKNDKKAFTALNQERQKSGKPSTPGQVKGQKDLMHAAGRRLAQELAIQKGIKEGKAGPEGQAAWATTHNKPLKSKLR